MKQLDNNLMLAVLCTVAILVFGSQIYYFGVEVGKGQSDSFARMSQSDLDEAMKKKFCADNFVNGEYHEGYCYYYKVVIK